MAAPLNEFKDQILATVLSALIPAMVIAGVIGLFKRDLENWIVAKLRILFHGKAGRPVAQQEEMFFDDAPCCPDCRRPMVRRTTRTGGQRGAPFWGCSSFPACRGTRTLD